MINIQHLIERIQKPADFHGGVSVPTDFPTVSWRRRIWHERVSPLARTFMKEVPIDFMPSGDPFWMPA